MGGLRACQKATCERTYVLSLLLKTVHTAAWLWVRVDDGSSSRDLIYRKNLPLTAFDEWIRSFGFVGRDQWIAEK